MAPTAAPGLYVHVPFCARVCPYCDFAVLTGGRRKRQRYVEALLGEIQLQASRWSVAEHFDTVYLGGGTPSALQPEQLASVIGALRRELSIAASAEITLEANPEDIGAASLAAWRRLGITRLSLGVQSFHDPALATLGRAHSAAQAAEASARAIAAGFDSVSIDLIFAVPGQGDAAWEATLRRAVSLCPAHISCYELTVHNGTRLFDERARGSFREQSDDRKAEQFFAAHRLLADAGYQAYEVSNFSRHAASRSRHNRKYWCHAPYLGIGPAAHSFDGTRRRWWNHRQLAAWLGGVESGDPVAAGETLSAADLALEALGLGLRTTAGVDLDAVHQRFGVDLRSANRRVTEEFARRGLLESGTGSRLVPTLAGLALADHLAAGFEIPHR